MSRRKRFIPKDIESAKGVGDTSANIYRSMLLHPVCKDLTASQFRLYVYCKSELYGKNRHDLDCIQSGYTTRTKSLYRFSTRWQLWGTKDFTVPTSVMTTSMLRELNKKDGGSDDEK